MKVSPGGSLPGERAGSKGSELGANWEQAGSEGSELEARGASWCMLYYVLGSPPPLWGQGVRGVPQLTPLTPLTP